MKLSAFLFATILIAIAFLVQAKSTKKDKVADSNAAPKECRYEKGPWSDCDNKTNLKSRQLTLKKKTQSGCEAVKTITKKCRKVSTKSCKYEKGAWTECNADKKMIRIDTLKSNSNSACESQRQVIKKCKKANHKKAIINSSNNRNNNNHSNNNKALKASTTGGRN